MFICSSYKKQSGWKSFTTTLLATTTLQASLWRFQLLKLPVFCFFRHIFLSGKPADCTSLVVSNITEGLLFDIRFDSGKQLYPNNLVFEIKMRWRVTELRVASSTNFGLRSLLCPRALRATNYCWVYQSGKSHLFRRLRKWHLLFLGQWLHHSLVNGIFDFKNSQSKPLCWILLCA